VFGVLLVSPSLFTGLVADDYFHALSVRDDPAVRGLQHATFDLFRFATGSERRALDLMEEGIFPWWADPHAVFAFFRPLASVSHYLDYRAWPGSPLLMHAQSLLWFAALLVVVAMLFRRFTSSPTIAALALLLFAVDDAHAPAVAWLANRNLILALAFSLPALVLHDRYQKTRARSFSLAAHASFVLGLCAGEGAAMCLGYLCSYAVFLDRSPAKARALSVAGYVFLFVLWRGLYNHFGYGVIGSGLYVDPGRAPLHFLASAVTRLPILLLATVGLPWSDFWEMYPLFRPGLEHWVFGYALGFLAMFGWLVLPLLRSSAQARFWAAGCVLSCLPACSAFPHDRLLVGPSIGAMALLAELFSHFARRMPTRMGALPRVSVVLLGVLHLVFAPFLTIGRSATVARLDVLLRAQDRTIPSAPSVRDQTLVLLNPPIDPFAAYFSVMRQSRGLPRPAHVYWLATGVSALRVSALDPSTLSIRPEGGFLASSSQCLLRGSERRLALGDELQLEQASFIVSELTSDGRPAEVRVRFRNGLRDASLNWLEWQGPGYRPFVPPLPGETKLIPAVDLSAALFG
jgi:hypothetical protein